MALELSNQEQARIQMAESAELMASTDFWKELMQKLAGDEASLLLRLDDYLNHELHPDREEVITMTISWHENRKVRLRLLQEVETARSIKASLTQEESPFGELYGDPGIGSAAERG